MIKKALVGALIAIGAGLLALVSYSYLTSSFASPERFVLREGTGIFWEKGRAPKAQERAPNLGYLAPDFTLFTLDGRAVTLGEWAGQGKPLLLNFWASWCPPCRVEMPDLQAFHEQYGRQVTLLGINWAEDPESVRSFLARYEITYENVLDRQGKVFVAYRLTGVPTSFFLDEAGVIRGIWLGPLRTDEIAETFSELSSAFRPEGTE